jgi:hypothetical protein
MKFGGQLNRIILVERRIKIAGNATNEEERQKYLQIFQDNFTCTNYNRLYADAIKMF